MRDLIPQIIERSGKSCSARKLSEREYIDALDAKLSEEVAEYRESSSIEELADVLETFRAILAARKISWDELEKVRATKREERGGFEDRIWLVCVDEPK